MQHPWEAQRFGRREFLARSAAGVIGLSAAGTLLAACGGTDDAGGAGAELQLARPDRRVTLPLFDDNPPVAAGLEPEAGPLRIYNWNDYLWKKKLKDFEKEYGVEVELTTFTTMDEAITKLSSGATSFDVFFPTTDRISRLATGKLLQPLNLEYVPNLERTIWPSLRDPFYDVGSQYTVPYVIWTTGIGYRADRLQKAPDAYDNPYDVFWDGPRGKTYVLDDARDALGMALLRRGETDVNTEDGDAIDAAKRDLLELVDVANVKVSTEDYTKVSEGAATIHQAWSGSMIAAPYYLPKGTDADVLGFWFPADGAGTIGSDTIAVLRSAKSPVLAHHFLNFMLDEQNAYDNFAQFVGYQPPLVSLDADRLVTDEVVPPNLRTAVVRESDFERGYQLLELSPAGAKTWQNAWAAFKAGL